MAKLERKQISGRTHRTLDGKVLANGDRLEMLLRGNAGWTAVVVDGLPDVLRVRLLAGDGHAIVTSLPDDAELRWP